MRYRRHLTLPQTNVFHNVEVSAARYPHKPFIVFYDTAVSFAAFLDEAERIAGYLQHECGVQAGDRVLLYMQNCPQYSVAYHAILRANAVVVPVNPMNRAEELKHYITDPDAKVAITTGDLAAEFAKASDALPPAERLAHLIVTQFTDAFDPAAPDGLRRVDDAALDAARQAPRLLRRTAPRRSPAAARTSGATTGDHLGPPPRRSATSSAVPAARRRSASVVG